jgi:hypothetical protein
MMDLPPKNQSRRFQVKHGKLSLSHPSLPDLGCLVQELDDNGCRGSVLFQYVPEDIATAWRRLLATGQVVRVNIDIQPWLQNFSAQGMLTSVVEAPAQLEIELAFHDLSAEQKNWLQTALVAIATQKIRTKTQKELLNAPGRDAAPPADSTPPTLETPQPKAAPSARDTSELPRSAITLPTVPAPISEVREAPSHIRSHKIGEVLIHMGHLKPAQLEEALAHSRTTGERLGRYLVRAGVVAPDVLCRALALQTGLPMTDLRDAQVPESLVKTFTHATMLANIFVPFDESKVMVCIATANPLDTDTLAALQLKCSRKIEVFLAQEEQILKLLDGLQIKQNKKLRKHLRYDIRLPVRYQFCSRLGTPAESVSHDGVTHNISEGGMLLEGVPCALGTPDDMRRRGMCVSVIIQHGGAALRGLGHLRALREKDRVGAEDPRWMLGLELVDMSVEDRRKLKEICVQSVNGPKRATRQPFL